MRLISKPRRGGKTTELIRNCHNNGRLIVCHSRAEARRIYNQAVTTGYQIVLPITYDEFMTRGYFGRHIDGFCIDNLDMFLSNIAGNIPVTAATLTSNEWDEENN